MNLLNNFYATTVLYTNSCGNNNKTVLSIYDAKINIKPNKNYTLIEGTLNARINEDSCNYDFRKIDTYTKLQDIFTKIIIEKMDNVLNNLKLVESNALDIGKLYYDKYQIEAYNLWMKNDIKYDLDLKINKKGLIFEVE